MHAKQVHISGLAGNLVVPVGSYKQRSISANLKPHVIPYLACTINHEVRKTVKICSWERRVASLRWRQLRVEIAEHGDYISASQSGLGALSLTTLVTFGMALEACVNRDSESLRLRDEDIA